MINKIKLRLNAFKLGLNSLRESDVFIVSYPKSGNTWLRFVIANLVSKEVISFKNINQFIPGIYGFKEVINKMRSPRFIKTHDTNLELYPKSVYIYRDYRDVVVSYYYFQKSQNLFTGTVSEFIRSEQLENFGSWCTHVEKALKFKEKHPERILILSFEEMLKSTSIQIEKIKQFCNIEEKKTVDEVSQLCSFGNLQKTEQQFGKVYDHLDFSFFRSGKTGQWKTELNLDDILYLENQNKAMLTRLNYALS